MPLSEKQIAGRAGVLVTASEVPDLMGEGRRSYFELWHQKAGLLDRVVEETEAMAWGNALEAPIARQVAKNRGWKIRKVERHLALGWHELWESKEDAGKLDEAYALRESTSLGKALPARAQYPLGASLDYEILGPTYRAGVTGWLPWEIKAVGRYASRAWENGQPHLAILLQVQPQLAVARAPLGVVAGLRSVTGPEDVAEIPRHEPTIKLIFRAVLELELSLARGEAPPPDLDRKGDVEAVIALHKAVTDGKVLDLRQDQKVEQILADYRDIATVKGCAEKESKRLWAELLHHLGSDADFRELIANESKAVRWTVAETEVAAHTKKAFTSYGVYRRKG
jgi:predicted phage-related endonuclease